nr:MAG TPA: hypothetical protein [Caudoviricetes sp.]
MVGGFFTKALCITISHGSAFWSIQSNHTNGIKIILFIFNFDGISINNRMKCIFFSICRRCLVLIILF